MSTPHRDDEPEQPEETAPADAASAAEHSGGAAPRPGLDAAWADIVANYGERHDLGVERPGDRDGTRAGRDSGDDRREDRSSYPEPTGTDEAREPHELRGAEESDLARGPDDRFVPPPPPPLPWVSPPRLVAWLGLLGVPVAVLLALMFRVALPAWVGTLAMVWFVGGFAYLVSRMRRGRDDPGDGAVV